MSASTKFIQCSTTNTANTAYTIAYTIADTVTSIKSVPCPAVGWVSELPASAPPIPAAPSVIRAAVTPVVPYDPRDEASPPSAFFTPAVQDAVQNGMRLASEAVVAVRSTGAAALDEDLQRLLGDAERLQTFSGKDTRTIAVLGDSGEGKSSLINSLLHVPDLAFTSDLGAACTSIATEYRQKAPAHTAPYTVEVEYLAKDAIHDLLKELLWDYRRLYRPGFSQEETSDADFRHFERASEQAWSALSSAFGHKGREFTPQIAQDMSEGVDERLLAQLTAWADEMEWPQSDIINGGPPHRDGFWTATAETTADCVALTKQFMLDRYWPFTKIIRVYLGSKILEAGVVLTDLPGLHDTNLARVRVTQDYLLRCDHVLLVAKIARARTDQSLRSSLFLALAQHVPAEWEASGPRRFNITVVCTRTEDIDMAGARRELAVSGSPLSLNLTRLDRAVAASRRAGDYAGIQTAKREQKRLLIEARNDHVRAALQQTYAAETNGQSLNVFCVSNKWYEKHGAAGNVDLVQASGIPALRQHCQAVAADARLAEAMHFLRSTVASLLASLGLWTARQLRAVDTVDENENGVQGTGLDVETIYQAADDVRRQLLQLPVDFERTLQDTFQEHIVRFFAERSQNWSRAASDKGAEWKAWHHTQYHAWCAHDGDHTTAARGYENWNALISWKMRTELDFSWELFEEEATTECQRVLGQSTTLLRSLEEIVNVETPSDTSVAVSAALAAQQHGLRYTVACAERVFLGDVRAKRRATSEANSTSYIVRVMIPTYRSAAQRYGRGRMAAQHRIVQGHLEDDTSLFPIVGSELATEMDGVLRTTRTKLQNLMIEVAHDMMAHLDLAFGGRQQVQQRQQAERIARQATSEMVARVRVFDGIVKRLKERHEELVATVAEHAGNL
ncbi:hypothetical protein SBRCBS47491_004998 [Sporothrix bragantina]|uniref:Uncharacterized protein n=1 Tax=Sporothrix bragantina TaxID=671064 RepID=A0ABP0BSY3_9PEZI